MQAKKMNDVSGFGMKYMGTAKAAELWGVNQDRVRRWCRIKGKQFGVEQDKKGSPWRIPVDTPNPFADNKRTDEHK